MLSHQIKTPSDLKAFVEDAGHCPHFFDRKTMRFFGDTMRNYGIRKTVIRTLYDQEGNYHEGGIEREVFQLFRRNPVKHGLQKSAFFCAATFQRVFSMQGE